jgi:hypothetical protein
MDKTEKLILQIGAEGGSERIYEQKIGDKIRIFSRNNKMTFDENMNEIWVQNEIEYETLEDYWNEILKYNKSQWYYLSLKYVDDEYKQFIADKLLGIDKTNLSEREQIKVMYWESMI